MHQGISFKQIAMLVTIALVSGGFAIQSDGLLTLGLLAGSVFLTSWLWLRFALTGLTYQRAFSENRAFVGETVTWTLTITNRKWLPLTRLRLTDYLSAQLTLIDLDAAPSPLPNMVQIRQYLALSWYEQVQRTYHIQCDQRGIYDFRQATLQTGDPFHFITLDAEVGGRDRLIVYPQIKPIIGLKLPEKEPFGDQIADRRLLQDPIYMRGVRLYQPEDDLRFVHWKATARTQELQTKIFEPTTVANLVIFANIATFAKTWEGIDPVLMERVVSVTASICAYAVEKRLVVGLSANGALPLSDQPLRVLPNRNPQQLTRLLEALAAVRGIASAKFETFLLHESARLPWGATLMVITAIVTPEMEAVLLRLKEAGRKLVLLSLAEASPPWINGLMTYHLPGRAIDEAFHFSPVELSPLVDANISEDLTA